jgi:hypothetical protein
MNRKRRMKKLTKDKRIKRKKEVVGNDKKQIIKENMR